MEQDIIKYCLYARKSSESEERQILSIDSQIREMLELAQKEHLQVVDIKRESYSAKEANQRPIFNELIADIRAGKYTGILTWAPDRISRNAGDLGVVVDLMDQKLLREIRTYSQHFTNSPNEKFLLMILGSQAKLENDNRGINVKRGLRTRCEMGLRPGVAPTGYLNDRHADRHCHALIDPERAPIMKQMFEKVAQEQWGGRRLHLWLRDEVKFRTRFGKPLALANIYILLKNPFYYGVFEYPVGSGNWYQGQHEPLITKDLFDKVQEQITRHNIVRSELKEYAFTKRLTCGGCGSGVTADEKYKRLKDGTTARYVYYGCSRSRNLYCKNGYIREEKLIEQLVSIIDQIDVNELGMLHQFQAEVARINAFQSNFFQSETIPREANQVDIRGYAKYLLREGSIGEKRTLLGCIKSKLILTRKVVTVER